MAKRAIKKGIANPIEMVKMGNCPRNQQESFQKWVTKKPMISDVENLTTATMNRKKIITNGIFLVMTVMVHGDITGRLTTGSGKTSKSITS